MKEALTWWLARSYARVYGFVKDRSGRNLRGLGRALRLVHGEHVFTVGDVTYYFDPLIAGSYDRMVAGDFNEPQTAAFLEAVLNRMHERLTFIDVGANVGEFLVSMAAHPLVERAIGFEPNPRCADACRRSAALNGLANVIVHEELVGDGAQHPFATDVSNPNASGIAAGGDLRRTVRIDDIVSDVESPVIMLIDVEGAEPLVLAGAQHLVQRTRPLIIFEYNYVSRAHYRLPAIKALLHEYRIFRLRDDGRLDDEVEDSWNCVAVPQQSAFDSICRELYTNRGD